MISPMRARSPHEPHRVSTPLELLFDLVFVVAIAQAAGGFHHAIAEGHAAQGVVSYLMVFFAIWWAWMNFTWFASAYDPGDVPYKLAVFVQITGALIVAAGIPAMFEAHAPNGAVVSGYVVMRLAMVAQWLRAAASDPERRTTALRFAGGISVVQVGWVAVLFLPANLVLPAFVGLRRRRAGRAGVGRERRAHHLAPASHHRALRPLHHHRAGRVDPGRDGRRPGRARVWRAAVRAGAGDHGRPAHGVLAVVALLLPARSMSSWPTAS